MCAARLRAGSEHREVARLRTRECPRGDGGHGRRADRRQRCTVHDGRQLAGLAVEQEDAALVGVDPALRRILGEDADRLEGIQRAVRRPGSRASARGSPDDPSGRKIGAQRERRLAARECRRAPAPSRRRRRPAAGSGARRRARGSGSASGDLYPRGTGSNSACSAACSLSVSSSSSASRAGSSCSGRRGPDDHRVTRGWCSSQASARPAMLMPRSCRLALERLERVERRIGTRCA